MDLHAHPWVELLRASTTPAALAEHYTARRADPAGVRHHALRHPVSTALAAAAIARLPREEAALSRTGDGATIRARLRGRGVAGLSLAATGVPVLPVPETPEGVARWAHTRAVRRKVAKARAAGVVVELVPPGATRGQLADRARRTEAAHVDEQYRVLHDDAVFHAGLVAHALWLVARAPDGEPLVLVVAAVDGEWADLEYFRTLGHTERHSDSRYLALQAVVELARSRGIRRVMTNESPAVLPSGLLHLQRMTGWHWVRVRVTELRSPSLPAADSTAGRPAGPLPSRVA